MQIRDIFATQFQERIEPIVQVADRRSTTSLDELQNLVITPQWEHYLHQILQAYTEAFENEEERNIGIWISGFFGSGKSLLMKVLGILLEGGELEGQSVHNLFLSRLPHANPARSDLQRFLTLCQRRITCTAIGGNVYAGLTDDDTLTLIAFKLFARACGYTSSWPFAWTVEYLLDARGLLPEFHRIVSEACGVNWDEIAEDADLYSPQLYEAAAAILPKYFSGPAAVEQAIDNVQRSGITPEILIERLLRWCKDKDANGKHHKLLLQFDGLDLWIQSERETDRILQVQALVETASILSGGRVWIAVTAHGDIEALKQNMQQEHYAKIDLRFGLKCKLTSEDINTIVQERLLRKTILAASLLRECFQQNSSELYDLGSLKETQRVYPLPDAENFAQYYPYMPWTVAVVPDVTKGIAQTSGRGEELIGSNRTMIGVIQGGILDAKELLDSDIGKLICLADLYSQLSSHVPIETRTDLSRVRETISGGNDYTTKVAHALYLLGQAHSIPCTLENIVRALVTSINDTIAALQPRVKTELDRLVAAGYAKQIGNSYVFLSVQQRSFQGIDQPLYELLQRCTVHIGPENGSGFFVAPGLILTCAHVIDQAQRSERPIEVHWNGQTYDARIVAFRNTASSDIALIQVGLTDHPCVYLDEEIHPSDRLYCFGYPRNYPNGNAVTLDCEGWINDQQLLLRLRGEPVLPGMSGSPLLNVRTGGVCGVVRGVDTEIVEAIPTRVILQEFLELVGQQQQYHQQNTQWFNSLDAQQRQHLGIKTFDPKSESMETFEVYFSYAHEDEELFEELLAQLDVLRQQRLISWHDPNNIVEDERMSVVTTSLDSAQVILLLISPAYLNSDYCFDIEMKRAMERHEHGESLVIPILLHPTQGWQGCPFGKLQALPRGRKPISTWKDRNEVYLDVVREIQIAIEELTTDSVMGRISITDASPIVPEAAKSIEIFYAYADEDKELVDKLEEALKDIEPPGLIKSWHHRKIGAGKEWEHEIATHLNSAQIILLLVSPDFLASEYCYNVEMLRAMERHEAGEARVIPILLHPVNWERMPFGKLQPLPTDNRPISLWQSLEEAMSDIAKSMQYVIREFYTDHVPESTVLRHPIAIEVFLSYAHEDVGLLEELRKHLVPLKREALIVDWYDREISPGAEWEHEIIQHLYTAQIILVLISPSYLASPYNQTELKRAMDMYAAGDARVIPIILHPASWLDTSIGKLQALPQNGKPITQWSNRNEAFSLVVRNIQNVAEGLKAGFPPTADPTLIAPKQGTIEIFYSYTDEDEDFLEALRKHISILRSSELITDWYNRMISPGLIRQQEIDAHLDSARIILLLISPDYLRSDSCKTEMKRALERLEAGEVRVIPIILKQVEWKSTLLAKLPVLPGNARPLTDWKDLESAFLNVVRGIRNVIQELNDKQLSNQLIWNVPYQQDPFFTGRQNILLRLHDTFTFNEENTLLQPQVQVIIGLAGIGKTATVVEYAYRYRSEYKVVLWVRADSQEMLISDFAAIASLLNLPEREAHDKDTAVEAIKIWLEVHSNWLLVFDDVYEIAAVEDLISRADSGHVLMTSHARAQRTSSITQVVELTVMTREESTTLLLRRANIIAFGASLDTASDATLAGATKISDALGYLPFALMLASAYIEETACSLADYFNLYWAQHTELLRQDDGIASTYLEIIAITWSLSFREVEQAEPAAAELLRFCAFLNPDIIPEEIIVKGASELGQVLGPVATDPLKLNKAIRELLKYSLIRRNPSTRSLSVHRLVQSVLRDNMDEEMKRLWAERATHILNLEFPASEYVEATTTTQPLPEERKPASAYGIFSGHDGPVHAVAITPDGYRVVSASGDGTLKVWDIQTGAEIRTLTGHTAGVNGCAVSPQGDYVVSASQDRTLKVWNIQTGAEIRTLTGHTAGVNGCTVSPQGDYVVSASQDGTSKVWDLQTGHLLTMMSLGSFMKSVAITPDARHVLSADDDSTLKLRDVRTGNQLRTFGGHNRVNLAVAVTPDSQFALSACADSTIKVWDLQTGSEIYTFRGHTGPVLTVAVTPDGHTLVSGSDDKTVQLWDLQQLADHHSDRISHSEALARIEFVSGDLLELHVDSLVNPTGVYLENTGSIGSQLIDRIGLELYQELHDQPPLILGEAFVTGARSLATRYLIHTRTESIEGHHTSESIVRGAIAALNKAESLGGVRTIAFPALGSGSAGLDPFDLAPEILKAIANYLEQGSQLERIVFAFIDEVTYRAYIDAYRSLGGIVEEREVRNAYRMSVRTTPIEVVVGQQIRLDVELLPVPPSLSEDEGLIKIPQNIAEVYCFVKANGMRIFGTDVKPMLLNPLTGQLTPANFELQAQLQGTRDSTVELFVEEPDTGRIIIYRQIVQVTVTEPETRQERLPILPSIEIRLGTRPDFILQVDSDQHDDAYRLTYHLSSRLRNLQFRDRTVGQVVLHPEDLNRIRILINQTLRLVGHLQPEDVRAQMRNLGMYLFDKLFPTDSTTAFREIFWQAAEQITTWLIVEDGEIWIPWELMVPYRTDGEVLPSFLGERYQLSRWIAGYDTTLYSEVPLGAISLVHYKDLVAQQAQQDEEIRIWGLLLRARYTVQSVLKLQETAEAERDEESVHELHVLRYADHLVRQREIVVRDRANPAASLEQEVSQARLDLRLRRPLVTLGIIHRSSSREDPDISVIAGDDGWSLFERVLPFLHAGASAVVGPWWLTSEEADKFFWPTFYHLLNQRVRLGEAVWHARLNVKKKLPHSPDWLAYTLFGDPCARPYRPKLSEGYTILECLNPDEPLRPGKTYFFRASIRRRPPIWHQERLVRPEGFPQRPRALFLAPGLQTSIPEPMDMVFRGRDMVEAIIGLTPEVAGNYLLTARLLDGRERLQSLQLSLVVGGTVEREDLI